MHSFYTPRCTHTRQGNVVADALICTVSCNNNSFDLIVMVLTCLNVILSLVHLNLLWVHNNIIYFQTLWAEWGPAVTSDIIVTNSKQSLHTSLTVKVPQWTRKSPLDDALLALSNYPDLACTCWWRKHLRWVWFESLIVLAAWCNRSLLDR